MPTGCFGSICAGRVRRAAAGRVRPSCCRTPLLQSRHSNGWSTPESAGCLCKHLGRNRLRASLERTNVFRAETDRQLQRNGSHVVSRSINRLARYAEPPLLGSPTTTQYSGIPCTSDSNRIVTIRYSRFAVDFTIVSFTSYTSSIACGISRVPPT